MVETLFYFHMFCSHVHIFLCVVSLVSIMIVQLILFPYSFPRCLFYYSEDFRIESLTVILAAVISIFVFCVMNVFTSFNRFVFTTYQSFSPFIPIHLMKDSILSLQSIHSAMHELSPL